MGQSRVEQILNSKIYGDAYNDRPQSRVEELLLDLDTSSGGSDPNIKKEVDALKNALETLETHSLTDDSYKS